jgi:predicted naringenin-chalcone synthase
MQILQLSSALPEAEYSTEKLLETFPCKLPEGVKRNVFNLGVSKRYLVNHPDQSLKSETVMSETKLVDLCCEACKKALERANLSVRDVDFFVAAYDTNPFLSPGLSQLLIRNIGFNPYIKHFNAQGIASTAFPKALELAENYLAVQSNARVLICVSGVSSYWFQNQVRGLADVMDVRQINQIGNKAKRELELRKWVAVMQYFLFGDGVSATVVANAGEGFTVKRNVEVTNVSRMDYLAGYSRLAMLNEPFKFGFYSHLGRQIPDLGAKYTGLALKRLLGKDLESTINAAKKWAIHTGSGKILNMLAEHHGIEKERLKESHEVLREFGNLAGASLPFILERIISNNKFSEGDIALMLGYGWGFSASATLLEFNAMSV